MEIDPMFNLAYSQEAGVPAGLSQEVEGISAIE